MMLKATSDAEKVRAAASERGLQAQQSISCVGGWMRKSGSDTIISANGIRLTGADNVSSVIADIVDLTLGNSQALTVDISPGNATPYTTVVESYSAGLLAALVAGTKVLLLGGRPGPVYFVPLAARLQGEVALHAGEMRITWGPASPSGYEGSIWMLGSPQGEQDYLRIGLARRPDASALSDVFRWDGMWICKRVGPASFTGERQVMLRGENEPRSISVAMAQSAGHCTGGRN